MGIADLSQAVLWLAFLIAFIFGAIGQKTHFCTMGAVADIVNMGNWSRMRMWLLAIGVAILGVAGLHASGLIDLNQSIYWTANFTWLSYLVGGFCFGIGMVLASGCGAKTLMRIGAGSLKSLIVFLVTGLVAYMTLRGIFAQLRINVLGAAKIVISGGQDIPNLLSLAGVDTKLAFPLTVFALGGTCTVAALRKREDWTIDLLLGGLGIGLTVVAAWYVSGHLAYLAEHPETLEPAYLTTQSGRMESLSFIAPQAYTLELLMLWSDTSRHLTFGITTVLGVVCGSSMIALLTGNFRWEGFTSLEDTVSHLIGATLMGFGGVVAMGCTIGQGISGVSTLALGSFLSVFSIIGGAVVTLKIQYWRILRSA